MIIKMTIRQNAKQFVSTHFPELSPYRFYTSRKFEANDGPAYYDDWWFQLPLAALERTDFVVFAGADDSSQSKFQLFKVPSKYISANLGKLETRPDGKVWMYIHVTSFDEIRKGAGVSFRPYAVN